MKLPLTVDGRDVVARFAGDDVTVRDVADAVTDPVDAAVGTVAGRTVALDHALADTGLRPGDDVQVARHRPVPQPASGLAVHVVAGIDAGRVIAVDTRGGPVAVGVGRGRTMAVRLSSPAVSKHHCTLTITPSADGVTITVADAASSNGTVVRGVRLGSEPVALAVGEPVRCGPAVLVVRRVPSPDPPRTVAELLAGAPSGPVPFYRSPVDLAAGPPDEVAVPAPPRRPRTGRPGLIGLVLGLTLAAVLVRVTGQWMYAMFALMSPVMMMVSTLDRAGRNRRVRRTSRRRYRRELQEFETELAEVVAHELRRRRAMHPDLAELVRRAEAASTTLWDRRRDHPQFLTVSLGLGDLEWEPPLADLADGADDLDDLARSIDEASVLRVAPLAVSLGGATVGLAGEREAALATTRGLLLQLAAHHGPADVRIVAVVARSTAAQWDWIKWLPHVRPSSFAEGRLLVVVADEAGVVDGTALDDVIADAESGAELVVVVDTTDLADAGDFAIRRLLRRDRSPASGIVLAPTVDGLPDRCDVVVDHHEAAGEATCRWPREGGRSVGIVAAGVPVGIAERAARALARFTDPAAGGGSAALPVRVSQAQILGLDTAEPSDVQARWAAPGPLAVVVGVAETGPAAIDLDATGPHLVVVGGRGAGKTEHLLGIVTGLAATHPPERLHLVLWGESFGHLHRLPHVASVVNRIDENAATIVTDGLDRELSRRERLRTKGSPPLAGEPRLVVVIDDVDTVMRLVPKATDDLVRILRRARGLGVHVVWSTGRSNGGVMTDLVDLSPVRVVLRVAMATESNDLLGSDAAAKLERSLPGRAYVVAGASEPKEVHGGVVSVGAPVRSARLEVEPFALTAAAGRSPVRLGPPDERLLVSLIAGAAATSARPADLLSPAAAANTALESPGLLELLGIDSPTALASVPEHWQTVDTEAFLRVPIGVDPELRPVLLDLKESALAGMGPHGLLVGATGSGKSELLRTLVSALALTHSPEMLAFVLVDFKGGASFASFGALPHVAGVVTNLADDMALIDRILAALGGEQRRRQELLARAGNLANVREYRAARRAGTLPEELRDEPLPQLLVIVDEFAELLDQEPAFIDFFLTIGRVGRSLGIHLLLASQRLEEGKLRGLDTYLSYRLGLRTFSAAESRIVLGVPDAYSLPSAPGGGYLKVGTTAFERFQASYVSGPVEWPDHRDGPGDDDNNNNNHDDDDDDGDHGPDRDGDAAGGAPTVMDEVVDRLEGAAANVHQIWLPPLAPAIPLDAVFGEAGFVNDPRRGFAAARWPRTGTLAVPAGVIDEPDLQRQVPLVVDFAGAHGNLVIVGAPQSGKSVLLRTIVLSLAVTHTPDEVQVYGIDLGGGTLEQLAPLPHVGTIASRLEPNRVARVIAHVEATLAERDALFREHGIDSAATFRQRRAAGELPADTGGDVVLVIDGWAAFRERFEALEPTIVDLITRGLGHGVHVVITANRWMEMRSHVIEPVGGRLELHVNNPADSMIDRKRAGVIRADQPGRGLHPSKRLFQVALPRLDAAATADQLTAATTVAAEHIASRWQGGRAAPVRLLPEQLSVDELTAQAATAGDGAETTADVAEAPGVLVGLQEAQMAPWRLDLSGSEPHFFVFGDGESGKTTFLHTWLTGLAETVPAERAQVVLVDYRRTLLEVVPESHLRGYAASEPAARELVDAVAAELETRLPGADVTPAQLRERSWWSGPDLFVVVDDGDLVVTPAGNPLAPLLPYLAQGRDLGVHVVSARRVAGATKSFYEPVTARLREVSPVGLILSGDRDEGPLLGAVRAAEQPPGRGILVQRRRPPTLLQVAQRG